MDGSTLVATVSAGQAEACPADLGPLRGAVNLVDTGRIAGWAQDRLEPDVPVRLEVLVGGKVVAYATADLYREELRRAGIGNGRHGFEIAWPRELGQPGPVQVRRAADGAALDDWARNGTGRAWRIPELSVIGQ